MGVTCKLGGPTPWQPNETVLHEQRHFRAVSSTCLPSYRIAFQMPPLLRLTLYVTNRRVQVVSRMFGCLTQEIDLWYPPHLPADRTETVTGVAVTRGLFGPCLELRSRDPRRRQRWLWSPDLTLRFFFANPERVERIIREAMRSSGDSR